MESKRLNSKVFHSEIYYNTKEQRPYSFVGSNSRGVKRVPRVSGEKDSGHYLFRLAQELRDPTQVLKAGCSFGNSFCITFFKVLILPTRILGTGELGSPQPSCLH